MEITLNEKSKKHLKNHIGISVSDMARMDATQLDKIIENKIGKKLRYQSKYKHLISRGSVFLYLEKFLGISFIDKKISKI